MQGCCGFISGLCTLFEDGFQAEHDPRRSKTPPARGTATLMYRITAQQPGTYLATPTECKFDTIRPTSPVVPLKMTIEEYHNDTLMTAEIQTPLSDVGALIEPNSHEITETTFYDVEQEVSTAQRYGLSSGMAYDEFAQSCTQFEPLTMYHVLCDQPLAAYVMDNGLAFDLIDVSNSRAQLMTINQDTLKTAAAALTQASHSLSRVDICNLPLNLTFQGDPSDDLVDFQCSVCVVFALS